MLILSDYLRYRRTEKGRGVAAPFWIVRAVRSVFKINDSRRQRVHPFCINGYAVRIRRECKRTAFFRKRGVLIPTVKIHSVLNRSGIWRRSAGRAQNRTDFRTVHSAAHCVKNNFGRRCKLNIIYIQLIRSAYGKPKSIIASLRRRREKDICFLPFALVAFRRFIRSLLNRTAWSIFGVRGNKAYLRCAGRRFIPERHKINRTVRHANGFIVEIKTHKSVFCGCYKWAVARMCIRVGYFKRFIIIRIVLPFGRIIFIIYIRAGAYLFYFYRVNIKRMHSGTA